MSGITIGKLARETGSTVETIRYYEREGLIHPPVRSDGNYRLYDAGATERLRFIRHCRTLDMTLDEIRVLLGFLDAPNEACDRVNSLLDEHIGHVRTRIAELTDLERQLKRLRSRCRATQASRDCGILQNLSTGSDGQPRNLGTHGRSRH